MLISVLFKQVELRSGKKQLMTSDTPSCVTKGDVSASADSQWIPSPALLFLFVNSGRSFSLHIIL